MKTTKKLNLKRVVKICGRGHKFIGNGPCPICWPSLKNKKYELNSKKTI